MKELYINDILCDLNEKDNPIGLTYEVNDLAELKDRQAYSTNSFKLPLTQNNRVACGFPDTGSIIGLQPYRKNTAKIVQDGIEILTNGIALINGCSNAIEVQCLSGLIGFFDLIDGKSIRDLDFSEYEHTWNLSAVVASQMNDEGYTYPIIDYGSLSETEKTVDVRQLRPAVYRKTIIEKIFEVAGYVPIGNVFSDERYLRSLLPFSNDKFEHGKSFIDASNTYSFKAKSTIDQGMPNDFRDGVLYFTDYATTDPGNNWNGNEYSVPATMRTSIKLKYSLGIRDQYKGGSTPAIHIQVQVYSGGVWTTVIENIHLAQGEFEDYVYYNQSIDSLLDVIPPEKVRIGWHSEPATDRVYGYFLAGAEFAITYVPQDVVFGQSIQLEATLPNISQKDFIKDFLQNFGLIAIPDNYNKNVKLINMQDVYENKWRSIDSYVFTNRMADIDYKFGSYGINNYGKYKKDEAVTDGLGDGVMVFDNLTLKNDVTLFTSQFSASLNVTRMNGVLVTQILKIADPLKSLDFKTKTEPRILMDEKLNVTITLTDGTTNTIIETASIPYFQQSGKLGLGYQELFDEHYPEILRMLYRPFVADKYVLLKPIDLANIDFTRPIYNEMDGCYYYNNGIKSWFDGEECKINLIKMP